MRAGQTLVAQDGYEVMLFPMTVFRQTAGEHGGQYAQDFSYYYDGYAHVEPYYAPCTVISMGCHTTNGVYDHVIWRSKYMVHTPEGLKYVAFMVGHDDNCSSSYQPVGTEVAQGGLIGYTGNKGTSTGNHLHLAYHTNNGTYDYTGSSYYNSGWIHIQDNCYRNDTPFERETVSYTWYTWEQPSQWLVTLIVSPEGAGYTTGQGYYSTGERAWLDAIPYDGWRFSHWNDGYDVTPRYWDIYGDLTLTAYFEQIPTESHFPQFNYDGTQVYIR